MGDGLAAWNISGLQAIGNKLHRQRGFSLVEVSIVTALMILMAIIGLPSVQGYVIENKVPRVAEDLQRFVARVKVSAIGAGPTPYLGIDQRSLINGLRDAAAVKIQGSNDSMSVAHGLGGLGSGSHGTIRIQADAIPGLGNGSAFRMTLTNVNHAACPALAAVMQRMAAQVMVGGAGSAVVVKNSRSLPVRDYDPMQADAQCQLGDTNQFEFIFQ